MLIISSQGDSVLLEAADAKYLGSLDNTTIKSFAMTHDGAMIASILMNHKSTISFQPVSDLFDNMMPLTERMSLAVEDTGETGPSVSWADNEGDTRPRSPHRATNLGHENIVVETTGRKTLFDLVDEKSGQLRLMNRRLHTFLNHFGSFPDQYR